MFDAREGHSVAIRTSLDPLDFFRFARPLALTGGTAYYGFTGGVVAWDLDADRVTRTGPDHPAFLTRVGDLVVATTRHGTSIVATRAGRRLWRRDALPFPRAVLSPDGARVLVLPASGSPVLARRPHRGRGADRAAVPLAGHHRRLRAATARRRT